MVGNVGLLFPLLTVCLQDSVLAFWKHGMQGKSFKSNEVKYSMNKTAGWDCRIKIFIPVVILTQVLSSNSAPLYCWKHLKNIWLRKLTIKLIQHFKAFKINIFISVLVSIFIGCQWHLCRNTECTVCHVHVYRLVCSTCEQTPLALVNKDPECQLVTCVASCCRWSQD